MEQLDSNANVLSETDRKIIDLLEGKTLPKNLLEKQMVLAKQLFEESFFVESADLADDKKRNKMMEFWTANGDSGAFRSLMDHPDFKAHPRLKGDPLLITLDDVAHYKNEKALPEA